MLIHMATFSALLILQINGAVAKECRLDQAGYRESVSGAVIQFRKKDAAKDASLTSGLFEMRLSNVSETFRGKIIWNAGSNARPDGEIARKCSAEESEESACWLWTGNVYSLAEASAGLLGDANMAAPKSILFSDFGRSLATSKTFTLANPNRGAFDVFTFTGCKS
jgi:hypothetical protein